MVEQKESRDWESWIDQQIREAQEQGAFDQLAGRGKPLDLAANPYARDSEMAFKLLKDAGYAPDWIEQDKAIRAKLERARSALARSREWRESRLGELSGHHDAWAEAEREQVQMVWRRAVTAFALEVEAVNKEIDDFNLRVPISRLQRSKIDAVRELNRVGGSGA
jgi:DnaJ family protein C protein 28